MLILEDYLLLVLDDDSGKPVGDASHLQQVAAGALLVELALLGRVELAGDGTGGRTGRIVVRDASPTGSALLDDALAVVRSREGSKPKSLIGPLARSKPATAALEQLAARGLLRREDGRVLGIFPTTRWPAADSRHEDELRGTLERVLVDGAEPDERTAALVAILAATKQAAKVLQGSGEASRGWGRGERRAVDRRAAEVAAGSWAGDATRRYVEEITAATTAAITAALVSSSTATTSG